MRLDCTAAIEPVDRMVSNPSTTRRKAGLPERLIACADIARAAPGMRGSKRLGATGHPWAPPRVCPLRPGPRAAPDAQRATAPAGPRSHAAVYTRARTCQAAALSVPAPKRGGRRSCMPPPAPGTTSSPSVPCFGRGARRSRGRLGPRPSAIAASRSTCARRTADGSGRARRHLLAREQSLGAACGRRGPLSAAPAARPPLHRAAARSCWRRA